MRCSVHGGFVTKLWWRLRAKNEDLPFKGSVSHDDYNDYDHNDDRHHINYNNIDDKHHHSSL